MFELLYNWVLNDLIGWTTSTPSDYMLKTFALLITYTLMFFLIYAIWWLVRWSIRFVSSLFPWGT